MNHPGVKVDLDRWITEVRRVMAERDAYKEQVGHLTDIAQTAEDNLAWFHRDHTRRLAECDDEWGRRVEELTDQTSQMAAEIMDLKNREISLHRRLMDADNTKSAPGQGVPRRPKGSSQYDDQYHHQEVCQNARSPNVQTARAELDGLKMTEKEDFHKFVTKFMHTAQKAQLSTRDYVYEFKKRLPYRLQTHLAATPVDVPFQQFTHTAAQAHLSLELIHVVAGSTQRRNSTWTTVIPPEVEAPDPAELFNFTRGRFVRDEKHELALRRREFNVGELAADRCLRIKKYPDGMYNRTLLLCMDNGKEIVAKIPNPNAGQSHFTTASEVATMKFAREVLNTPLPEVYDWCSRAQGTPVGAEFILMEKSDGAELEEVWPEMTIQDRYQVAKAVASYRKSWVSVSFEQFGSLYFAEDLNGESIPALVFTYSEGRGEG
ncbi:hypothetical protein E4U58_006754 [Claviceps cyperi]|nr:hypothetical protein E4U58_006754 [Claviceps cyperi]